LSADKYLASLKESIVNLSFDGMHKAAQEAMDAGVEPQKAILEGMAPAMAVVGGKFETGEYFLSELVVAGEIMKEGMEIITPHIKTDSSKRAERVVIATVEGDYHEIGKNLVATLLKAQGFEVVDLGTDVPANRIIEAIKEHDAVIVGLSALLTFTMARMGEVIKDLEEGDLRNKVKVIIGGAPVTPQFAQKIGADHSALNAMEGVHKCLEWMSSYSR
jgi:corrinoid protein of di/trimethylamine methyltransferase